MNRIAFFVSPHGFGHAARAAAVMAAVRERAPECGLEVFTTAPRWIFEESVPGGSGYHPLVSDVGLVQGSALDEDLPGTVAALEGFLPLDGPRVDELAGRLRELGCASVVADISPFGLAAARAAGLPSVLLENFTWDWIYRAYGSEEPRLEPFARELERVFGSATVRVQTEPVCRPLAGSVRVPPIARRPQEDRSATRRRLQIEDAAPTVLLTMGGFGWLQDPAPLVAAREITWVLFAGVDRPEVRGNLRLLPNHSPIFHPDLVAAADAVVGKLGYSTLAEIWSAGTRYAYVTRRRFPESPVLAAFARRHLTTLEIAPEEFVEGSWPRRLPGLLARPARAAGVEGGTGPVADLLLGPTIR